MYRPTIIHSDENENTIMKTKNKQFPGLMIGTVAAMLAIVAFGAWFYRSQEQIMSRKIEDTLTSIAQLKVDQIVAWRKERLADGTQLMERSFLIERIVNWMTTPQESDRKKLLAEFKAYNCIDVLMMKPDGRVCLNLNGAIKIHSEFIPESAIALLDNKPILTDLHIDKQFPIPHICLVVPLFSNRDETQRSVSTVVLIYDAREFFYPLITSKPWPSRTGEILLVKRENDHVRFLNDLRHQPDTAFKISIPLTRTEIPAVMAVLGREGVVRGYDHHENKVISAILPVPDSPWFIVTEEEEAEAFAEWHFNSHLIGVLLIVFLTAVYLIALFWLQREKGMYYRALYYNEKKLRQSLDRYRAVLETSMDGFWIIDTQGRVLESNEAYCRMSGYSRQELLSMRISDFEAIEAEGDVSQHIQKIMKQGEERFETKHRCKDGSFADIEISAQHFHDENTRIVAFLRDVTARKKSEDSLIRRIKELNCLYGVSALLESPSIAWDEMLKEIATLIPSACQFPEITEARILLHGQSFPTKNFRTTSWMLIEEILAKDKPVGQVEICYLMERPAKEEGPFSMEERKLINAIAGRIGGLIERKWSEDALRESEKRFHSIFEKHDAIMLLIVPESGQILDANMAAQDFYGYPIDTLKRMKIQDINMLPPDEVTENRRIAVAQQTNYFAFPHRLASGEIRTVEVHSSPIKITDSQVLFSIIHDITDRKQAEGWLRESEERFQILFNSSPVPIILTKIESGLIINANDAAASLLGYSKLEIIEKTTMELGIWLSSEDRQAAKEELLVKGFVKHYETRIQSKSGKVLNVVSNSNIITIDGEKKIITALMDITQQKNAEAVLKNSLRDKETLLREVYHRTKNNMQVVMTILNLQSDGIQDEKILNIFRSATNRIKIMAMVHQKLCESKDLSRIDLKDYFKGLKETIVDSYSKKSGAIAIEIDAESIFTMIDTAIPCGLILNELLSNALKYAFPGDRQGEIRIVLRQNADGEIEMGVEDNGVGLLEDMDIRKCDSLGLQLVVEIVENQLGGQVEVRREKGTQFRIRFKLPEKKAER